MNKSRPARLAVAAVIAVVMATSACGQTATPPAAPLNADPATSSETTRSAEPAPTAHQSPQPATEPLAATDTPAVTAAETQPEGSVSGTMPGAMPLSGRVDGDTPIVLGVGRAVGVSPDGSAVITTAAHPVGYLSCENSPALAFWLVPLDGSPRSLLSEHEIHSGGIESFSVHNGKAVWMQNCDGYPIGPYIASINDAGELSTIRFVDVAPESVELLNVPMDTGSQLGEPRWLEDGTINVNFYGQGTGTLLNVDPATGEVRSLGELPKTGTPTTAWQWEATTQRWIVPLSTGAEVTVGGLSNELTFMPRPIEHPTQPIVFLSMPSDTPAWFHVVAVPFAAAPQTEVVNLISRLPSDTALVGSWESMNEVLLPLRDGEHWLMQTIDAEDACAATVFIHSLNGVDQSVGTDLVVRPLTDPLLNGSDLLFTSGCPGGPQTLTWASLIADGVSGSELQINAIAKVPFASNEYFHSFEVNDDQLEASYGDPRFDTIVTLDRDGVLATSSTDSGRSGPNVRDQLCEVSTSLPPSWSVNIAGGGAGGIELDHPTGASVLAVCTTDDLLSRFEIDPRNNTERAPVETVLVSAYDPEAWYSPEDSFNGTRWRLDTATDGQPGQSDILQVQVSDRWIHVIANAPGGAGMDPDVVGAMKLIVDGVRVGTTGG